MTIIYTQPVETSDEQITQGWLEALLVGFAVAIINNDEWGQE